MNKPTPAEFAAFNKLLSEPTGAQGDSFKRCLDMATEYVEANVGSLANRDKSVESCKTAIFIIAKHEYGIEHGPSRAAAMGAQGELVVGPGGYLIPNRAKTLLDALRYDDPDSIGIG